MKNFFATLQIFLKKKNVENMPPKISMFLLIKMEIKTNFCYSYSYNIAKEYPEMA